MGQVLFALLCTRVFRYGTNPFPRPTRVLVLRPRFFVSNYALVPAVLCLGDLFDANSVQKSTILEANIGANNT